MSLIYAITLIAHIVLGIIGAIASYAVVLFILKKELNISKLKCASSTAFLGYVLSWFAGGYYYVQYYGDNVKPGIKEGAYPWAHLVVMEAKEHVFLILPFATLAVAIAIFAGSQRLQEDRSYRSAVTALAVTVMVLAVLITLSGILITGGAR